MPETIRGKDPVDLPVILLRLVALSVTVMAAAFVISDHYLRQNSSHTVSPQAPALTADASGSATLPTSSPIDIPQPEEAPGEANLLNPGAPLTTTTYRVDDIPFTIVAGGIAGTRRSAIRQSVSAFVEDCGARAGLNGTFFANASLRGTDNLLIGPSICGNETTPTFSPFDKRKQLIGRPLVLMSPTRTRIVPYDPSFDSIEALKAEVPDLTDAFLGGVWLVHHGIPVNRTTVRRFNVHDAQDPRRRAFFILSDDGRPGLGATVWVATSSQLARALAGSGAVREAVLLDSGFSTSLVADGKILVTGHTAPGIPSRPVPHAIVLFDPKGASPTGKIANATAGQSSRV
ncbi:MAG: hypothetical protein ACLQVD_01595 [Capsulimonadaceae bacterium]